jgi:hypothetical protein
MTTWTPGAASATAFTGKNPKSGSAGRATLELSLKTITCLFQNQMERLNDKK